MGYEVEIPKRSIGERHLTFPVESGGGASYSMTEKDTQIAVSVLANEAISAPCAIGANGLTASLANPAIGIVLTSVESGSYARAIVKSASVKIIGAEFEENRTVWLTTDTLNLSSTPAAFASGAYIQSLGLATGIDSMIIDISTPWLIE